MTDLRLTKASTLPLNTSNRYDSMETFKHEFGDWDWIEVRTESHHPYAAFTVAGYGIARKCYNDMPPFCTFEQAVELIRFFINENIKI